MRDRRLAAAPDVCVVGSGFAGLAAAERLAQQGVSVLLVDAGGADVSTVLPGLLIEGDADFDVDDSRVLAPGGTSARWNGVASRLEPETVAAWPLEWAELDPYLAAAEAWLQVAGEASLADAEPPRAGDLLPSTTNLRPAHLPSLAHLSPVVLPFAFVDGGPRRLAAHDLPRVAARPEIHVRDGTWVRAVEPARRGAGVRVHLSPADTGGGIRRAPDEVVNAGAVVLACGVVETVHVLLASRSRWGRRIGGPRLGVGINAHPRRRCTIHRSPELDGLHGVLRSYRVADAFVAAGLGRVLLDVNYMEHVPMIDVTVEQQVSPSNRIVAGPAGLTAQLQLTDRDHATLRAADQLIGDVCALIPGAGQPSAITTRWFHPAGGCAMALDASSGVVDRHGEVFGAPGVYVVGAAAFPTSGAGNPTLTITALAMRLADHLASRHPSRLAHR